MRIKVPTPPSHGPHVHSMEQNGVTVCHIWIFSDKGASAIETQYKNAAQISAALGVSRATAYRIIQRHGKRYWCADMRDENNPKVYSVLPWAEVSKAQIHPVGNPNFRDGIYQQHIALRRAR